MKSFVTGLVGVLLVSGCFREYEIDGVYLPDIEYNARVFCRSSRMHFGKSHSVFMENTKEAMRKTQTVISIRYPKYRKSMIKRYSTTPTSKIMKLKQVDDELYLMIDEGFTTMRTETPLLYNRENDTLMIEELRYRRK